MFALCALATCALLSCVHGGPSYGRDLPYLNISISTSSASSTSSAASAIAIAPLNISAPTSATPSTTTQSPYTFLGTGTGLTEHYGYPNSTILAPSIQSATRNATANFTASCTVNIPNASIDWWYAATYSFPTATLTTVQANFSLGQNYLTAVPVTETFDLTSALQEVAYVENRIYDSEWDVYWTYYEEYAVTPTAAFTSVITRSGAKQAPLPTDGIIPATDAYIYLMETVPPSATATIALANKTAFVATSATPLIYFSDYEVESAVPVTGPDGTVSNTVTTKKIPLSSLYSQEYNLKGVQNYATASGTVPSDFLLQIPQSACKGGRVQAIVTVLFVVDLFLYQRPRANPFIVHIESTATGWEDVEPTRVGVQDTGRPNGQPITLDIPMVMKTAIGFDTTDDIMAPAAETPSSTTPMDAIKVGPAEPTQKTVGTIGGNPVVIGPSSVVVVGSQTLTAGAPAVTVGGVPVSLVPSGTAIVVGGTTSGLPQVAVPTARPRPPPILTIGTATVTGNAATQFLVAPGQTLTPGGTATISGTLVSLAPGASFVVIGGSTQVLPTIAPIVTGSPEIVLGGSTFTANLGSTFIVSGQTLTPGQAITVGRSTVSLAPGASFVVVNGQTSTVHRPLVVQAPPQEIVIGGSTFTAAAGNTFVVSGQTLVPGQAITVDGKTISLGPSASFIVVNGVTSTIANAAAAHITAPPLTIGNGIFTAQPGTGTSYIIGSETLTPGGVITVAGTTISLAPGATAIVVNGQTTMLAPSGPITNPPILTIGSQTITALPGTGTTFIIGGQTLTPGGVITVDGTTISLAPGATELVYGSSGRTTTTALFPATTTRSQSITANTAASAGASGGNGNPAATSSPGAGPIVRAPMLRSCLLSLVLGVFGGLI